MRTSTPTERVSLHGNYFDRLDVDASYSYSEADMKATLDEYFNGLLSRTRVRQFTVMGPATATRISNVPDLSATFRLTRHLRLADTFRFWAFRIPEGFNANETDWAIPGSGTCATPSCSLLVPITSTTQSVTPPASELSLNQNWKRNEVDGIWDGGKHFGGRVGFRYGDRLFTHVLDFTNWNEDTVPIHEYTPLFGLWVKPATNMRVNFDWERTSNDKTIVRIGAREEDRYWGAGELRAEILGGFGRIHQCMGCQQWRRLDGLSRAQPQLRADNNADAAGPMGASTSPTTTATTCRMPLSVSTTRTRHFRL